MNLLSLYRFQEEINQIKEYLKHIQQINNIVDCIIIETDNEQIKTMVNSLKSHYKKFSTGKKIFEYKAKIISLYGILENFVETWIKEYLDLLSGIVPTYELIDEKVRESHFELSIKLISHILTRDDEKYKHLKKEDVLNKLNDCMISSSSYTLNTDAFFLLSGNLKHKKIVELFKSLNLDLNDKLKKNQTLTQYIQEEQQIKNISNLNQETLYNKINDLVDRRNEIAHGSEEAVKSILADSEIEKYIQFLEKYCQAIFEILDEALIEKESIHKFKRIDKIIDIYANKILAIEIEDYEVRIGDVIIVKTAEDRFLKKKILEIQKNNISYPQIKIRAKTEIALRVDPNIKKNQAFFLIKK